MSVVDLSNVGISMSPSGDKDLPVLTRTKSNQMDVLIAQQYILSSVFDECEL